MRILHLYKDYHPVIGGIENHVQGLAEAQAEAGHRVTVLVCSPDRREGDEEARGIRVIRAGRLMTAASMPVSFSYLRTLARLQADVAHVHMPFPLGAVGNWLWGKARATVVTYHCDIVRQRHLLRVYAPLQDRVLRSADAIITTSPFYAATSRRLRAHRERCAVVPLAIDASRFSRHDGPRHGILFVGRLRYYKRLDTLLRAVAMLPDASLTVVGDGPMRPEWERLSTRLALRDRVRFVGTVPDPELPKYYAGAAVFVLPAGSRAEAFGTVLLEAMAAGLPVVSTELGTGTSWVNRDGTTGRVVPPDDPATLAAAIREILDDVGLRQRMGRAARTRIDEQFDLSMMVRRVEEVYTRALIERDTKPVTASATAEIAEARSPRTTHATG